MLIDSFQFWYEENTNLDLNIPFGNEFLNATDF